MSSPPGLPMWLRFPLASRSLLTPRRATMNVSSMGEIESSMAGPACPRGAPHWERSQTLRPKSCLKRRVCKESLRGHALEPRVSIGSDVFSKIVQQHLNFWTQTCRPRK